MAQQRGESWIEVLAGVVAGLRSNETLSEFGAQARDALAELRGQLDEREDDEAYDDDSADESDEDSDGVASAAGPEPVRGEEPAPDAVARRLDALSASLEELTDLFDAGLERLETVEMQLGDPDDSADARVQGAVERCENRLAAIEYRLGSVAATLSQTRSGAASPGLRVASADRPLLVLVVDGDCRRRCDVCLALESEGFHCLAVADVAAAASRLRAAPLDLILVRSEIRPDEADSLGAALEEFAAAMLAAPPVAVLVSGAAGRTELADAARRLAPWPLIRSGEGGAALAAAVSDLATSNPSSQAVSEELPSDPTQESTRDVSRPEFQPVDDDAEFEAEPSPESDEPRQ